MPTRKLVTRYEDDLRLFPDMWHKVGLVVFTLIALTFPFVVEPRWVNVGNMALVSIVGSVALMILTGFAGQISLGHAAFLGIGAYTAAALGEHLGVPFWLGIPAAGVASAVVGLAVGPFALRLRGLYLAIITLGLLFVVNHVLVSMSDLTGGVSGLNVPMHWWFPSDESTYSMADTTEIGPITLEFEHKLYFLYLLLAVAAAWICKNIARSNLGRAMVAVRDHDLAAAVLGVHPARTKVIAFGVSSFFAGVAGAMFAFQQQYITVDPPFNLNLSVQYIAIIVLGGIGTTYGAVAGAIFFVAVAPLFEVVGEHIPFVKELTSAQQATLLLSVVVCGFLLFEPLGLTGIWLRIKRYFLTWPFRY